ncbi:hypothetical protein PMAYCL1PPCAC_32363 [Pristionchus mayeri]|uniref:Dehydrogenase n=1 Tax=Pristionchus mayeri TaxID=1317129 RepID=A0AAN5DFC3_9BILA|nr:hypothetical protein PMAYCL1PPCAC_32363 [Pristionchus mayeri]
MNFYTNTKSRAFFGHNMLIFEISLPNFLIFIIMICESVCNNQNSKLAKKLIFQGSSNGIGRETAKIFVKEGAKVTITGRSQSALEETKKLCLEAGAKPDDILELIGDITCEVFNEQLIATTVEKFGRLDVLVNNAGGGTFKAMGTPILEMPLNDFDKMIDLNVKPVLRLSKLAAPHLEKTKGAIINVSSIAAHFRFNGMPFYAASKSALDQITVQLAGSLIKSGIRVNSVNPGPVLTNFVATCGATLEQQAKMYESMTANPAVPLGRIGMPADIGQVILFLADRSKSEILVGQIITADGGSMLQRPVFFKVD